MHEPREKCIWLNFLFVAVIEAAVEDHSVQLFRNKFVVWSQALAPFACHSYRLVIHIVYLVASNKITLTDGKRTASALRPCLSLV